MKYLLNRYLRRAQAEHWAIGQFNFSTLEQLKGIIIAARDLKSPVIVGTSEGENRFIGLKQALSLVKIARDEYRIPIFLNLDHGKDLSYLSGTIRAGYDAVHIDGSALALEGNIKLTKKIVGLAKGKKIVVEGEVGHIFGGSEVHKGKPFLDEAEYTDPKIACEFVKKTKVDSLAILIGNVHGTYDEMPEIDHDRLVSIRKVVKSYLVFHGGSGFSEMEIEKVIKEGIVKVNINTELRVAWKEAISKAIESNRNEFKPYKILEGIPEKVAEVVAYKIKLFGSQNKI